MGQHTESLIKVETWLDRSIDELYEQIKRNDKNNTKGNGGVVVDPHQEYRIKRKLHQILMAKAEAMLVSKSQRRRRKFIDLINEHSDVSVNYQLKSNWIEKFIE